MVKVELNGWWGAKSAFIKKDNALVHIQTTIQDVLTKLPYNVAISRREPHIEVTGDTMPKDQMAYDSINGADVDVTNKSNWDITPNAIMLKIKPTYVGKQTHFTIAYSKDLSRLLRPQVFDIIKGCLQKLGFDPKW